MIRDTTRGNPFLTSSGHAGEESRGIFIQRGDVIATLLNHHTWNPQCLNPLSQ